MRGPLPDSGARARLQRHPVQQREQPPHQLKGLTARADPVPDRCRPGPRRPRSLVDQRRRPGAGTTPRRRAPGRWAARCRRPRPPSRAAAQRARRAVPKCSLTIAEAAADQVDPAHRRGRRATTVPARPPHPGRAAPCRPAPPPRPRSPRPPHCRPGRCRVRPSRRTRRRVSQVTAVQPHVLGAGTVGHPRLDRPDVVDKRRSARVQRAGHDPAHPVAALQEPPDLEPVEARGHRPSPAPLPSSHRFSAFLVVVVDEPAAARQRPLHPQAHHRQHPDRGHSTPALKYGRPRQPGGVRPGPAARCRRPRTVLNSSGTAPMLPSARCSSGAHGSASTRCRRPR